MNPLFQILFNNKSNSTHSKLALDAVRHINAVSESWKDFFLYYNSPFLRGSRAPDREFKDYKNHVLHVNENNWGGAPQKTLEWFSRYVSMLKNKNWKDASFSAAVVTHYFSDAQQPLHTAQSEAEGKVHKFFEWAVLSRYNEIQHIIENELGGIPEVNKPNVDNWVRRMVIDGAKESNKYYEYIIVNYDIEKGHDDPGAGLSEEMLREVAKILQRVIAGCKFLLEEGIRLSGTEPPKVNLTLRTFIERLQVPMFWVTRKIEDVKIRKIIEATYREIQETGKVVKNLGEDDMEVRKTHAREVLRISLAELDKQPPKLPSQKKTPQKAKGEKLTAQAKSSKTSVEDRKQERDARFYLELDDPVEEAPGIGAKTAERLNKIGIVTVKDLLATKADEIAAKLEDRRYDAATVDRWQKVARLQLTIPNVRGHDVQLLHLAGFEEPEQIAKQIPKQLRKEIRKVASTKEGERILRNGAIPDLEEVADWINWASQARSI